MKERLFFGSSALLLLSFATGGKLSTNCMNYEVKLVSTRDIRDILSLRKLCKNI